MRSHTVSLDDQEFERLKRLEAAVRAEITGFSAADRLSRDQLHERGVDVRPAVTPETRGD
jgi:hypothetical protein